MTDDLINLIQKLKKPFIERAKRKYVTRGDFLLRAIGIPLRRIN